MLCFSKTRCVGESADVLYCPPAQGASASRQRHRVRHLHGQGHHVHLRRPEPRGVAAICDTLCSLRFPRQLNPNLLRPAVYVVPFPRLYFEMADFGALTSHKPRPGLRPRRGRAEPAVL